MDGILVNNRQGLHKSMLQKLLLFSGILSIIWYVIINIIVPLQYTGYNIASQTVSELSAIDAPTRSLWITLCIPFTFLTIVFGFGVWSIAAHSKNLRMAGMVIVLDAIIGAFWPPMHRREVIAAGGGTLTDTLHLVWTFVHLVFILLLIWFGTAACGRLFRIYSIATVIIFIVFGILTARDSSGINTGEATPFVGVWERINMAAYMSWIVVFAVLLLRRPTDK